MIGLLVAIGLLVYVMLVPIFAEIASWPLWIYPGVERPWSGIAGLTWPLWWVFWVALRIACDIAVFHEKHLRRPRR